MDDQQRFAEMIDKKLKEVKEMLLQKNHAYGDSAVNPIRVFSQADPKEQLLVRIDDKLSRVKSGKNNENEDVILDLLGYFTIYSSLLDRDKRRKEDMRP